MMSKQTEKGGLGWRTRETKPLIDTNLFKHSILHLEEQLCSPGLLDSCRWLVSLSLLSENVQPISFKPHMVLTVEGGNAHGRPRCCVSIVSPNSTSSIRQKKDLAAHAPRSPFLQMNKGIFLH